MAETPLSPDTQHRFHPEKSSFWATYLGLVLHFILFVVLMVVAVLTVPFFKDPRNWLNLFNQSIPYMMMALAMMLPTRLKGIDLSAGGVFAVSGTVFASLTGENMMMPGMILALAAGLAMGAVNGAIQMSIRVPTAVRSMTISAVVSISLSMLAIWNVRGLWHGGLRLVQVANANVSAIGVFSLIAALVLVLLLLYFTKIGEEGQVKKRHFLMTYACSGLIFSLAACYTVMRLQMCSPNIGLSAETLYLLFVAGTILISRSAKIRIIPVVCALMASLNWILIPNLFSIMGVEYSIQRLLLLIFTAAILIPAFFVQRGCRTRI